MARTKLKAVAAVQDSVMNTVLDGEEPSIEQQSPEQAAAYVLIGSASIPVSKKAGKRWKGRIEDALVAVEGEHQQWDASYTEYRKTNVADATQVRNEKLVHQNDTDENLTRENVKILLRSTYTRNPKVEFSSTDPARKPLAKSLELTLSTLMNRKAFPGLNAKARIRRAIVHAHLTNFGILKVGYQDKAGSKQEALQELYRLRKELSEAKKQEDIDRIYAELEQNEDNLPLYTDQGMLLGVTLPHKLIIDPACTNADLSDANWVAEEIDFDTAWLKSRYMEKKDGDETVWVRKSDKGTVTGIAAGIENNNSGDEVKERVLATVNGITTDERRNILAKNKTTCYMIWDKLTREISLYMKDDMTYPLWVSEDQLKLSRFFQHHIIQYTEPLDGVIQAGESTHYVGHVREVNKINKRVAKIRMMAFGAMLYNSKSLKPETVTKLVNFMKNPEQFEAMGIDFDPEKKLSDIFQLFVPPDSQVQQLYDKTDLMKTVDRINATTPSMRGEQLKTNTTNKIAAQYSEQAATVTNELTDIVEDAVEELAWSMSEIIISKYTQEQVAALIGTEAAKEFKTMTVEEFNANFGLAVAAGSTEKPTSENKKKEAIQIAQGLGQFGQAAPGTTMQIIVRMFSEAFSEFLFTDDDKKLLDQEIQRSLAQPKPGAPGTTPPGGPGGPPPNAATSVVTAQTGA